MKLSITFEGFGLTWPRWKEFIFFAEESGFSAIYKSDHFAPTAEPCVDFLETIVALTYLADNVPRVYFGTLISPISFRDPVMLARQAMALNELSNGRMILGVSTGWWEQEHKMFGYPLGTPKERADQLHEGLEVIARLIRSDTPQSYSGNYFQLEKAILPPCPKSNMPLLIGGEGPKRTLPLVARFADIWNFHWKPFELFVQRMKLLDELLIAEGRQVTDVKRTVKLPVLCWRTEAERTQLIDDIPDYFWSVLEQPNKSINQFQQRSAAILGSPRNVVEEMQKFEAAGAEEFIIQILGTGGNTALRLLTEEVLPHFK